MEITLIIMIEERMIEPAKAETPNLERAHYLDSARGFAALTVVASHMVCGYGLPRCLSSGQFPLHVLWHGEAAVQFFFVLSGFVLSASLFQTKDEKMPSVLGFTIRRIFRIYPAFWAALLLSVGGQWMASWGPGEFLLSRSNWWVTDWSRPADIWQILREATIIGQRAGTHIIPPDWTLYIEIIYSILIPVLAALCRRQTLTFCLVLLVMVKGLNVSPLILSFSLGILIAKFSDQWIASWRKATTLMKVFLLLVGLVLYSFRPESNSIHGLFGVVISLGNPLTFGSGVLLLVLLGSKSIQRLLEWRPFVVIGKLSYSIYLIHTTVLLALVPWISIGIGQLGLQDPTAVWFTCLGFAVAISVMIAYPIWRWVEIPLNRLGKKLAARFTARFETLNLSECGPLPARSPQIRQHSPHSPSAI
jgi:peptidoglycan/LPS O-acetylase OafA/YrhL